ncbi:MAG: hypothetical protein Hyperionvirus20_1, partial [Hyperionvirus sp.]
MYLILLVLIFSIFLWGIGSIMNKSKIGNSGNQ